MSKPKHPKIDRYLISLQRHEINWVRNKFNFWEQESDYWFTYQEVKELLRHLIKTLKSHSRKKIYKELDKSFKRA